MLELNEPGFIFSIYHLLAVLPENVIYLQFTDLWKRNNYNTYKKKSLEKDWRGSMYIIW